MDKTLDAKLFFKCGSREKDQTIKHKATLSSNLKQLLTLANISEHELSRRIKVAQPIIHRILTGENVNPKLMTLKPIADYFMISVSQLIGEHKITSVWKGFTSKEHQGWNEVPLLNWEKAAKIHTKINQSFVLSEFLVSKDAFAVYTLDTSMEPIIPKFSIVIVETELKPNHGDFVALKNNQEEIIIRNFFLINKKPWISPINREFGSLLQLDSGLHVQGTVVRTMYDPRVVTKK